jgi:hypothetical protein
MKDIIKKFDFFPKVSEAVNTRQSAQGGIIFTIFLIIMGALCFIEFYTLILGDPKTEPFIEVPDLDDKTRVNLNISIYDVPCEAISLDYQDITGTHFEDMEQTMFKLHLDNKGNIINQTDYQMVLKFENRNFHPSVPVWEGILGVDEEDSCYGAELYKGQKCYTCQDVQNAYLQRGWPRKTHLVLSYILVPPIESIKQCNPTGKRRLMEEMTYTDLAENKTSLQLKNKGVYLDNSLYAIRNIKENSLFTFDLFRNYCEEEESVELTFEFNSPASKETVIQETKPLFFKKGECRKTLPLRVVSFDEKENSKFSLSSRHF